MNILTEILNKGKTAKKAIPELVAYSIDKIQPERALLTKTIKESEFDNIRGVISKYNPETLFTQGKNDRNLKNNLIADMTRTHGFSVSFEDGKINVFGKLDREKIKELAYLFHLMGVENFEFSDGTGRFNEDFAKDFQSVWNESYNTEDKNQAPKYERIGHKKNAPSSFTMQDDVNIARDHVERWQEGFKRGPDVLKWGGLFSDGFTLKVYSTPKAKKESGKEGKWYQQNWDIYLGMKRRKDGTSSFFFDMPPGKQLSEDDAIQFAMMAKKTGMTHMTLDHNLHELERGSIAIAMIKKGIVPVMKPDIPIIYKICVDALDKEVAKPMMTVSEKNENIEKLLKQIKVNTMEATGKPFPENDNMKKIVLDMEMRVLEGYLTKERKDNDIDKAPVLMPLSLYHGKDIVKIRKLIDENENIAIKHKIELKKELISQVKATSPKDLAVKKEISNTELNILKQNLEYFENEPLINLSDYNSYNTKEVLKDITKHPSLNTDKKLEKEKEFLEQIKTFNNKNYGSVLNDKDPELTKVMKSIKATVDMQVIFNGSGGLKEELNKAIASGDKEEIYIAANLLTNLMQYYYEKLKESKTLAPSDPNFYKKGFNSPKSRKKYEDEIAVIKGATSGAAYDRELKKKCAIAEKMQQDVMEKINNDFEVGYSKKTAITPVKFPVVYTR